MGYENVSFYSNISLHNKFVPFYHRSWVCSGNIKVIYSINGAYRQSSHRRSSCSPFQTGAGISGSSLFSEERLYIPSSMHAIWSLSHRHIIPWAEVIKVIISWNSRKQVISEQAYLQWIMVLFENNLYFLYNVTAKIPNNKQLLDWSRARTNVFRSDSSRFPHLCIFYFFVVFFTST